MSETFNKILIKDDRIGCITDRVNFGVQKGGQNVTSQPFKAISESNSAHVFNVAVPSLETIISREVLWKSKITLKITGQNRNNARAAVPKPPNQFLVNYGVTDALSPFPLHSLVSTMTATINNNTVSLNMADVLPAMLRLVDPEDLAAYNDMTPTTLDYLADYRDGVQLMPYQLIQGGILQPGNTYNPPAADGTGGTAPQAFISYPDNVLAFDQNRLAGSAKKHRTRGSYRIIAIYALDDANARIAPTVDSNDVFIQFEVTEPLLLSPFIFGTTHGKQGFYGIQTMNFQMNMLSNANRAWRSVRFRAGADVWDKQASIVEFTDTELLFQFLTPHASEMLSSRNVVPYYELPVYRTNNLPQITGRGDGEYNPVTGSFPIGETKTINSSNIQLNGIPDKLIMFVRRNAGTLSCCDTDSYLTIENIRINFNNQAGLLSSMSPEQLYTNSVLSGLANMSYEEFRGLTISVASGQVNGLAQPWGPYTGVGARLMPNGTSTPGFKQISTTGSMLVLDFAQVIQLTDEYYAPGSLGTFNLQVQLGVRNNHRDTWAANSYEFIIIPMNSGVFVNERGTSSTFLSLLTKQDVLSTLEQEPYTNFEVHRLVGGRSFMENLRSGIGWLRDKANQYATPLKHTLSVIPNQYAQTGAAVLGALGYGKGARRSLENRVQ